MLVDTEDVVVVEAPAYNGVVVTNGVVFAGVFVVTLEVVDVVVAEGTAVDVVAITTGVVGPR